MANPILQLVKSCGQFGECEVFPLEVFTNQQSFGFELSFFDPPFRPAMCVIMNVHQSYFSTTALPMKEFGVHRAEFFTTTIKRQRYRSRRYIGDSSPNTVLRGVHVPPFP